VLGILLRFETEINEEVVNSEFFRGGKQIFHKDFWDIAACAGALLPKSGEPEKTPLTLAPKSAKVVSSTKGRYCHVHASLCICLQLLLLPVRQR
jgi:hypothetical protein